ncbi:pilus assembly PilX N-terminal domain-containing protein [Desulfobacula sp.]|uniref:pilus assembly PilX family protein n=1 Tax=Desulfobacula sp. TaxID=2593537 RepID=UPI0026111B05|nr:pilus assembly PilX N-terminal domain-containing protein [Desulfobacula sp.]
MIKEHKKGILFPLHNQEGSAIIYALIMLVLLTVLGTSSLNTTTVEQAIAQNHKSYQLAFYAAEAARECVPPNTQLYHGNNITTGAGISFPIADGLDNDADGNIDESDEVKVILSSSQSFEGSVDYDGSTNPPRGTGYEVGSFKAHRYTLTAKGYGTHKTEHSIESGFYRIGF